MVYTQSPVSYCNTISKDHPPNNSACRNPNPDLLRRIWERRACQAGWVGSWGEYGFAGGLIVDGGQLGLLSLMIGCTAPNRIPKPVYQLKLLCIKRTA